MVVYARNPSAQEMEAKGSEVQGYYQLQTKFEVSINYVREPGSIFLIEKSLNNKGVKILFYATLCVCAFSVF